MAKMNASWYRSYGKRLLDLAITLPAIILVSPVLAIVMLLVRFNFGHPILFCQSRPGWRSKPFTIYKFRTMTNQTDDQGRLISDEKRLTRFGSFLRSASLDELPELFNVVKGDMSL